MKAEGGGGTEFSHRIEHVCQSISQHVNGLCLFCSISVSLSLSLILCVFSAPEKIISYWKWYVLHAGSPCCMELRKHKRVTSGAIGYDV